MSFKADYVDADAGKVTKVQLEDGEQIDHRGEFVPPVHIICYRTHIDWLGNARATGSHAVAVSGALGRGRGGVGRASDAATPGSRVQGVANWEPKLTH